MCPVATNMYQEERSDTSSEKVNSTSQESDADRGSDTGDGSHIESFSISSTERDSQETDLFSKSAEILKCLNRSVSELLPVENVGRGSDRNAIIRLNGELLRSKKSHWSVLDALVKTYSEIRELRVREQKLNLALSSIKSTDSLSKTSYSVQAKVLTAQLEFTKEELAKTKKDLNELKIEKRNILIEVARAENDFRLLSLESKRKDYEVERTQISLKHAKKEIGEKSDKINELENDISSLEIDLRAKEREISKLKEGKHLLEEAIGEQEKEIERVRSEVEHQQIDEKSEGDLDSAERLFGRPANEAPPERNIPTDEMKNEIHKLTDERDKHKGEIKKLKNELLEWERYGAR